MQVNRNLVGDFVVLTPYAVHFFLSILNYVTRGTYVFDCFSFFSRADFKEEPAFSWITGLSDEVKMAIRQSKVIFCNGYDFDDFSPSFIMSTIDYATKVGTAIFFDPGPRGKSLSKGTPDERRALSHFLRMSDVLLLTSEEVQFLSMITIW